MLAATLTLALYTHSVDAGSLAGSSVSLIIADKEPPRIVSLEPADDSGDIDAKKTTKLIAIFDRPMHDTSWSICGGGLNFPIIKGKPHWDTPKKIVIDVDLIPDHDYYFTLNCGEQNGFRTIDGVALPPASWSFSTAPEKLPDAGKQKAENRKALDALLKILPEKYSYYDLRVKSWDKLVKAHEAAIVGAKTTRGWARETAKMLGPTEDIHLSLRLGESVFGAGHRSIDPLFRSKLLSQYFVTRPAGERGLQARTDDGIGYVMIPEWSTAKDIAPIEQALGELRTCKALIVDVRPNAGGDDSLASRVAAWFVEGTKVFAKDRIRERAGKDGFGPVLDRTITGNKEADKCIHVPVVVLQSRYVMSSNESFVMMMKQAKDCTLVGQTTYGSSGRPRPHDLPNGVVAVIPTWQDMRLDGTCFEGEGLKPDVEVPGDARDFETKDPILEKALSILRDKLKRASSDAK
jgi:hypothetical protein